MLDDIIGPSDEEIESKEKRMELIKNIWRKINSKKSHNTENQRTPWYNKQQCILYSDIDHYHKDKHYNIEDIKIENLQYLLGDQGTRVSDDL